MRYVDFITLRTGGGKRAYSRAHITRDRALEDAGRALAAGRTVSVVRREVEESLVGAKHNPPLAYVVVTPQG